MWSAMRTSGWAWRPFRLARGLFFFSQRRRPPMEQCATISTGPGLRTRSKRSLSSLPHAVTRAFRVVHIYNVCRGRTRTPRNWPAHPLDAARLDSPVLVPRTSPLMPPPVLTPVSSTACAWLGCRWIYNVAPRLPRQYVVSAPVVNPRGIHGEERRGHYVDVCLMSYVTLLDNISLFTCRGRGRAQPTPSFSS